MWRSLALLLVLVTSVHARPADTPVGSVPVVLHPGEINNIVLAKGIVTSLQFTRPARVARCIVGSAVVDQHLDDDNMRLDLKPADGVLRGATDMILTIGGEDYVFVVQIEPTPVHAIYTRTYTIEGAAQAGVMEDLQQLSGAPRLHPADINLSEEIEKVERAKVDPVYRATLPDFRSARLSNDPIEWNGCLVHLLEVDAFLKRDLLLFKVEWVNTGGSALYLNSRQVELQLNGRPVRSLISKQATLDSIVEPGHLDTIWIAVQGEKYAYQNAWSIKLPPQARYLR